MPPVECVLVQIGRNPDTIGSQVVINAAVNIGNNGLYDLLFYCWINLGTGGDEGMEITTLDGDAPRGYIPPWLSGLSSCLCILW